VCRLHTSSYRSVRNLSNGLMQIRRFHHNRLSGVKALLRATTEKIWYRDQSGMRHSSVVFILSLEMSVGDTTQPPGLRPGREYVVRETDDERASEIATEFYPQGGWTDNEQVDPPDRTDADQQHDQSQRISELARRLGYREVKTRMLLGQWATKLAGLERKLRDELDQHIGQEPNEKGSDNSQVANTSRQEPFTVEGFPV
jgi:hypothetical protein